NCELIEATNGAKCEIGRIVERSHICEGRNGECAVIPNEFCVLMGKSSLPLDGGTTRLQEPWCSLIQHVRHNSKLSRRLR
ncbi:hypothetical protein M514_22674, partial [Trichuris suis]